MDREVLANIVRSYEDTAHSPEDVVDAILAAIVQADQVAAERVLGLYLEGKLPEGDVKVLLNNLKLGPRNWPSCGHHASATCLACYVQRSIGHVIAAAPWINRRLLTSTHAVKEAADHEDAAKRAAVCVGAVGRASGSAHHAGRWVRDEGRVPGGGSDARAAR